MLRRTQNHQISRPKSGHHRQFHPVFEHPGRNIGVEVFAGSNISMEDGRLAGQSAAKRRKLKPTANRGEGKKTSRVAAK
jgi:hypothetical protein